MSEAWSKANGCEASYNWDAGETSYCASNANGTGPFEITFREQDVRTVFEKNDNWWGNHYTHNIDKIELLPIKNDATPPPPQELQPFCLEKSTTLMLSQFKTSKGLIRLWVML